MVMLADLVGEARETAHVQPGWQIDLVQRGQAWVTAKHHRIITLISQQKSERDQALACPHLKGSRIPVWLKGRPGWNIRLVSFMRKA
jgi:hypothetical protein